MCRHLHQLARRVLPGVLLLALVLGAGQPAAAQSSPAPVKLGQLAISDPWARATPPAARTGAVYLTITNNGTEPDRLTAAATPAAASAELHVHAMEGGVARMRRIDAVEINPGEPALFQPGGLHVMLMGLHGPLHDGGHLSLTLTFARAGTVTVDVPVRRTAPAAAGSGMPGHGH